MQFWTCDTYNTRIINICPCPIANQARPYISFENGNIWQVPHVSVSCSCVCILFTGPGHSHPLEACNPWCSEAFQMWCQDQALLSSLVLSSVYIPWSRSFAFHLLVLLQTFGAGIDHPLLKHVDPSLKASTVTFIEVQLHIDIVFWSQVRLTGNNQNWTEHD